MLKPLIVAGIVAVVIGVECAMAYFLIPSSSEVEARVKSKDHGAVPADGHADHGASDKHDDHGDHGTIKTEDGHSSHGPAEHEVEVDLGKYNIMVHKPSSNVTLRVSFHLYGTLPEHEAEHFPEVLAKHQHRLRDKVILEIRNSQIEDLSDPGLALLKRKILAKSNELLGGSALHAVVFSDFSFVEQ